MLPQCYPNSKTVHRRFQQWGEREVLREILTDLANTLREEGEIDECVCWKPNPSTSLAIAPVTAMGLMMTSSKMG